MTTVTKFNILQDMGNTDMGQGTDSCGGWESEYDPYDDENLSFGVWTSQEGEIHVSRMGLKHLKNSRRRCERLAATASFTSEKWKWENWVEIFDKEIDKRELSKALGVTPKAASTTRQGNSVVAKPRGTKVKMKCFCGDTYDARLADLKRGWALCCSKRCAAIKREFGRPSAKSVDGGLSVKQILKSL